MDSSIINNGHVQLIIGPMFSGKTTELIRRYNRYKIANYNCIFIKHICDTRYKNDNNKIYTHSSYQLVDNIIYLNNINELFNIYSNIPKVICIDEGQFFNDIEIINTKLSNNGHIIIIAALDSTYEYKPFNNIINLICNCEYVDKLTSICMICFNDKAIYNKRITSESELEVIGGADKYMTICRQCKVK